MPAETPYDSLDEAALYAEIARRKLAHGIEVWNFPEPGARRARLIEVLEENDRFVRLYPQFALPRDGATSIDPDGGRP